MSLQFPQKSQSAQVGDRGVLDIQVVHDRISRVSADPLHSLARSSIGCGAIHGAEGSQRRGGLGFGDESGKAASPW